MKQLYILISTLFADLDQHEDRGAGMTEYALLVAFIALVAVVGVTAFGTELNDFFDGLSIG